MLIQENELLQLATKVVRRYVAAGSVPMYEQDDFVMGIVEKYWQKKERIESGYTGKAKPQTYVIAILNRMCCELIRKEIKHWNCNNELHDHYANTSSMQTTKELIIQDEVELLDKIMQLFGDEQLKTTVLLAMFFEIPIQGSDIDQYLNGQASHLTNKLRNSIKKPKQELFQVMADVVNILEGKSVKADAVRMWLMKRMNQIIARLNGAFHRADYDKESLKALFEHYYLNKQHKQQIVINS